MKKMSEPIVFFGSGPVAAESLRLLAKAFDIEAVVTKPRPLHHRGDVPVLKTVEELNLKVFTAENRKSLDQLIAEKPFKSKLAVLIDFGIIVSQQVIDYFPLGIVNSHFSLLPQWRGADPITFSILSGQKQTGVSLMLLTAGMDEGPLLAQGIHDIAAEETTPSLTEDLIKLSFNLLCDTLPRYIAGQTKPMPQEWYAQKLGWPPTPTYSRKLTKEDGILDWQKPAERLEREIRAFWGWPKSRCHFGALEVVVTRGVVAQQTGTPGKRTVIQKLPAVFCKKDALILTVVKPVGKQEMTGEAFLAGYKKLFLEF